MEETMERVKGKIITVGYVINGQPENWAFDCEGKGAAVEITGDNQVFYAGYSVPELEKISKEYWGA